MGKELLFQLLSRLGAEMPPDQTQNPFTVLLGTDGVTPDDEPYLRQYLGVPKDGGLIPTDLRPTKVSINDDLKWYRPAVNPFQMEVNGRLAPAIPQALVDRLKAGESTVIPTENMPGLGHFTASVAKGTSGNPFVSVYDKWDFDSGVVSPLVRTMMDRAGKGFHVYERYPLTKQRGGYRPAGDIHLPADE
ncbi:MAG: hypothetical protein AB7J46_06490 [Candidatus Altimarinota bacterium]